MRAGSEGQISIKRRVFSIYYTQKTYNNKINLHGKKVIHTPTLDMVLWFAKMKLDKLIEITSILKSRVQSNSSFIKTNPPTIPPPTQ